MCGRGFHIYLTTNLPMIFLKSVQIWQIELRPRVCGPIFGPTLYMCGFRQQQPKTANRPNSSRTIMCQQVSKVNSVRASAERSCLHYRLDLQSPLTKAYRALPICVPRSRHARCRSCYNKLVVKEFWRNAASQGRSPLNRPFPWGTWSPRETWFFGPIRVHIPNGTTRGSWMSDTQTAEDR